MIAQIENAIIRRLQSGLGQLVREVGSYSSELDDLPAATARSPAVWVRFGGIVDSKPHSSSRQQYRVLGQFGVMVAARSTDSYALLAAVRRLLTEQDLDLAISPLTPGKVHNLLNARVSDQPQHILDCEFACSWLEQALPPGGWPVPPSPDEEGAAHHPDHVFALAHGRTDLPDPPLLGIGLDYHLVPDDGVADARDILRRKP